MGVPGSNSQGAAAARDRSGPAPVASLRPAAEHAVIVIPARNEAADVGSVVRRAQACGLPVIVVDDHSTDRTAAIARAAGAEVLQLPFHAGSWAAIQAGLRYALVRGFDHVVTLDADGQHNPEDAAALLADLDGADSPDVVIASCPDRANQRRKVAWRVLRWLSGLAIDDLTSGFRAYNRDAVELLASQDCTLLEYQDVGVLLHLRHNRLRIAEKDVRMQPRCHGRSRVFSSWPMVFYYLVYSCLIGGSRRAPRPKKR